jgi:hypothetical protein
MVLSNAKLIDSTRSKQNGRRQETNQSNRNNNTKNNSNNKDKDKNLRTTNSNPSSSTTRQNTVYTGPNMVMKKGMFFVKEDYAKLTKHQKDKLNEFKNTVCTTPSHTVSVQNAETNNNPVSSHVPVETSVNNTNHVRQLLSNNTARDSSNAPTQVIINGQTYTLSYCERMYSINQSTQRPSGSLIDSGANGGLSGSDVIVLAETLQTVDVTGIADNILKKIPICTVAGLIQSQHGPIIGVFHQYAHHGSGKTIHSVSQLRQFGTIVDDTPRNFGGRQCLETLDGYIIPLSVRSGLSFMDMSPPTKTELETYPHVFFTSDTDWNPHDISDEYSITDLLLNESDSQQSEYHTDSINAYGELIPSARQQEIHLRDHRRNPPDLDKLSPNFGFVPRTGIQHTLDKTTNFARIDSRLP